MEVRRFCCLPLLTFLLCSISWTAAERKYEDVLFSAATCEEFGLGDDFDVCGVLEFCLGTVDESSDNEYFDSGESKGYYDDNEDSEDSSPSVSTDGNSRNDGFTDPLQTETFASESERAKSKSRSSPGSASSPAAATYGYRTSSTSPCLRPGPVVRLVRGRKHGLLLRGADPKTGSSSSSSSSQAVPANLHFHGLHVKGYGNGDDARRTVTGFDNYLVYELDLPLERHHGGTHWYHSHVQIFGGINAREQIKGGAFGPIVVQDAHDADVGTNDPNVLTFLNDPNHEKILFLDNTLSNDHKSYTANGIPPPNLETIHVVQNQWYRLRVLLNNVSSYSASAVLTFGTACKAHAIAHDGIPRFIIPDPIPKESFGLTSASRLDVAFICASTDTKNANVSVDGTVVAIFSVDASTPPSDATPFQTSTDGTNTPIPWTTTRLEYTRDLSLSDDDPDNYWTIHVDETNINDINSGLNEPLCDDSQRDFVAGQLQEWTITGADSHPLHLHVHPMQVVDGCGNGHEVGEYYDTIVSANVDLGSSTTKGGGGGQGGLRKMWWDDDERRCVVRVKLVDIPGPAKMHCHILEHAEMGASGWINVVTNGGGTSDSTDKPSCVGTCDEEGEARTKCSDL